jgi:hypothetical protein
MRPGGVSDESVTAGKRPRPRKTVSSTVPRLIEHFAKHHVKQVSAALGRVCPLALT